MYRHVLPKKNIKMWFDTDSLSKNVASLATKATKLAQDHLLNDPLLIEFEAVKTERDDLKSQLAQLASNGISHHPDMQIDDVVETLKIELETQRLKAVQKQEESDALLQKIKILAGDKIKRLQAQIHELGSPSSGLELDRLQQDLAKTTLENDKKSEDLKEQLRACLEQEDRQNVFIEDLQKELKISQSALEHKMAYAPVQQNTSSEHEAINIELESEIASLKNTSEIANQKSSEQLDRLFKENDFLQERLNISEEINAQSGTEITSLKESLHQSGQDLKVMDLNNAEETQYLNLEIMKLSNILSEQHNNVVSESETIAALNFELNTLKENNMQEVDIMRDEFKQSAALRDSSAANLKARLDERIQDLEFQISQLDLDNRTLEQRLLLQEESYSASNMNEVRAMKEKNTSEQNLHHEIDALKEELNHSHTLLESTTLNLKAELGGRIKDLGMQVSQIELENDTLEQKLSSQDNAVGDLENVILEQSEAMTILQAEAHSLKVQYQSTTVANERILSEVQTSLAAAIVHTAVLENQTNDYQNEVATLKEKLHHSYDSDGIIEDLNVQIEGLKAEVIVANQEISYLQSAEANQGVSEYRDQCRLLEDSIAELHEVVERLSNENKFVEQERDELTEKLSTFKITVASKIQQEMQESERLKELLSHATADNENLISQVQELTTHLSSNVENESKQEMDYLQSKTVELASQVQKSEAELTRLRAYLIELEDSSTQESLMTQSTLEEYQKQIEALEKERQEWASVTEEEQLLRQTEMEASAEAKDIIVAMASERGNLMEKVEQDAGTIKNLQLILSQFEDGKDQDIEEAVFVLKKALTKAEGEAKNYHELCVAAQNQLDELGCNIKNVEPLERELEEKTLLVGQMRNDILQLQTHLSEAMKYMKQGSNEDSVDRKLVSNLIVGFMTANYGDKKRFEILSVISSILKLSEEDMAKVGLVRKPGAIVSPRSSISPGENFMDSFITFLTTEASKNEDSSAVPSSDGTVTSVPSPTVTASPKSWFS